MRYRVARLGTLFLCALAACTTSLSYKFDAGTEGGTPPDGGAPTDGASTGCSATAQFCDDFEASTKWNTLEWTILDRVSGSGNGSVFSATKKPVGLGNSLELLGRTGPGGWAFPTKKFKRREPDKSLSIRFAIAFLDARKGTFLEIGPQNGADTVRVSIDGPRLSVNATPTGMDLISDSSVVQLEVVLTNESGSPQVHIPRLNERISTPALPDEVEVRFGVTPLPTDEGLPAAMTIRVDDIVIE